MRARQSLLVLEDGRCFAGQPVGAPGETTGEVVFNTSMTGYQEILTDPSYCGQIVCFTTPHIGNYGVCDDDAQARRPALAGVVLKELSPCSSSWRAQGDLQKWLQDQGIVGLAGVDTRALTRHLRQRGAMRGVISCVAEADADVTELVRRVRATSSMEGQDLASQVTAPEPRRIQSQGARCGPRRTRADAERRIVLVDYGVKQGIVEQLSSRGLTVDLVPAGHTADQVLELDPHGVVLSNGPGDPAAVACGIATARQLLGRIPMLGICLGHQILALALNARTYKLPFGHHGGNHPVRDEQTGEVWITAQNHGFAVDPDSLPHTVSRVTHVSLYDGTLEGFDAPELQLMAVQFHPEGAPGPSDGRPIFDRFLARLTGVD